MEPSLYRYILTHSKKDQIGLIFLSLASLPLVYITLELPKKIINLPTAGLHHARVAQENH
jgi:putative ABC transport system ATP-binding protein